MEPCSSRAVTRRQAADEAERRDEQVKRIRIISNIGTTPSSRDIIVESAQVNIKMEPSHIKTEPETIPCDFKVEAPPVTVKNEMEVYIPEEELVMSENVETARAHVDCSCRDEMNKMKEPYEQQLRDRDLKIEAIRNESYQLNEKRCLEIEALKASFEDQKRDLAKKMDTVKDELEKKLEEKDKLILELNARLELKNNPPATIKLQLPELDEPTDERVTNLFPQVLELVWFKLLKSRKDATDYFNLNCRLACKTWSRGMIQLLQRDDCPLKRRIENKVEYSLTNQTEITHWLKLNTNNPFRPTVLSVGDVKYVASSKRLREYRLVLQKFLHKFGSDIIRFTYDIAYMATRDISALEDWYSAFLSWLELMPNIQVLILREHNEQKVSRQLTSTSVFMELVRSNPIPHLAHISELHVSGKGILEYMFQSIIATNGSLQNVKWNYNPVPNLNSIDEPCSLPGRVMECSFPASRISFDITIRTNNHVMVLCSLRAVPLRHLNTIVVPAACKFDNVKVADIFQVVESFKTLTRLDIQVPIGGSYPPLNIPGLKKLNLVFTAFVAQVVNMDHEIMRITSTITSLQELTIENLHLVDVAWGPDSKSTDGVTRGCLRRCLKTNFVNKLWELLPLLKIDKVKCCYRNDRYMILFLRTV